MNTEIKQDVLAILTDVIKIMQQKEIRDVLELKELSNHTLHNASIFQDHDAVTIGVLVYALAKIFERDFHNPAYYARVTKKLIEARSSLERNDIDNYRLCIKEIFSIIQQVDYKLRMYIEEVLDKARINKGSRLFAHGLSIARVAEMLNVSRWELMEYVGKTRIADQEVPGIPIKQRIKLVRQLLK